MIDGQPLETVIVVTPFGFRLWDPLTERSVTDLEVTCSWGGGRARTLPASRSGVFQVVAGSAFAEFARGRGDRDFWANPPQIAGSGLVKVRDRAGRYLPFRFSIEAPPTPLSKELRDLCTITAGSPSDEGMPRLTLLSASSRQPPVGMAMAVALVRTTAGVPAARAIIRLTPRSGRPALGVADDAGSAVVFIPYPKPEDMFTSPPSPGPLPLSEQTWTLGLDVFYGQVPAGDGYPDLCALLEQVNRQPSRVLAADGSNQALSSVELRHGRVLTMKTNGVSDLLIQTA